MATQTVSPETTASTTGSTKTERAIGPWDWWRGALGGFIGSMGFGLMMAFIMPPPLLEVVIPNMYGIAATPYNPAPLAGWFFHQFHGVTLGLAYVAYVELPAVRNWMDARTLSGAITHGLIWGVVTTLILAVLAMPLWLQAVGFPMAPPFPNIGAPTIMSLIGHLVYAMPLAILYAMYRSS